MKLGYLTKCARYTAESCQRSNVRNVPLGDLRLLARCRLFCHGYRAGNGIVNYTRSHALRKDGRTRLGFEYEKLGYRLSVECEEIPTRPCIACLFITIRLIVTSLINSHFLLLGQTINIKYELIKKLSCHLPRYHPLFINVKLTIYYKGMG